ncbi:branched-chain amino acid ABC transporter permease [Agaricicola taiwanensis]|uniref:Branched-chain amino acid ABC transporter permease n=1 Tax=Agaricicola taiwanensis TaxID=591372 RepID=A0A8J2VLB6_9RHOB|nr:urea ABC transporter permease subunit UrtB [Agaricicola taiwanensis]GGE30177.1 branched-chain amino acid ABC transporter permease [Agaricicola taiwanensis]
MSLLSFRAFHHLTRALGRSVRFCALAGLVVLALAPSVHAEPVDDALAAFAADGFDDTQKGIDILVSSGHDSAEAILAALSAGKLMVRNDDKALFIEGKAGAFTDARTGASASVDAAKLKVVRLNNRLRRSVQAALGAVTLQAPSPARRIAAARAVQRSRDPAALPAVDAALARETDNGARAALQTARAAIIVAAKDAPEAERIAAVELIAAEANPDAAALLRSVQADAPQALRTAAEEGIAGIERSLAFWNAMQNVTYGISLGSVLLLAAIGLAITFGVMGVINMAHGEMVMIGAYTTYVVQDLIRDHAPQLFGSSLFFAIPLAFLVSGAVGVAIERGVIRFLYGRPLETLLATWGISLILQQAVRTIFGPSNREVGTPDWMSGAFQLGGLSLTYNRVAIVIFAMLVFAALLLVLKKTTLGLQVRAVTQNRRMASSMGIRTDFVDAMTFGLGSGVAGIAGVALSQIDNVSPNLGQGYIIDSFMVVVFGGVGNLWGTLVGALTLGVANKFLEPYAGAVLGKIILLVAIILFIQKRPRGLFALKGRAVEA